MYENQSCPNEYDSVELYFTAHFPSILEADLDRLVKQIHAEVKSHDEVVEHLSKRYRIDADDFDFVGNTEDYQSILQGEIKVYAEVYGNCRRDLRPLIDSLEVLTDLYGATGYVIE